MITLENVVAGYTPGIDILHGISLHVEQAEIVTLLGPNGCGKSTLLKSIAGFVSRAKGGLKSMVGKRQQFRCTGKSVNAHSVLSRNWTTSSTI
jgi:ABC-type Fe3+/spermidine/putrescine transport system ATPase subunit